MASSAAAVTATRTTQVGRVERRFLRNLAGTVAASMLVFVPAVLVGLAYMGLWRPDGVVPPVLLVGGFVWGIAGLVGLIAVADRKQGGGDNWFD